VIGPATAQIILEPTFSTRSSVGFRFFGLLLRAVNAPGPGPGPTNFDIAAQVRALNH
jgi:hypothetical protein